MNLRLYVGTALLLALFLAGNIIIIGLFQNGKSLAFSFWYFAMCILVLILLMIVLREILVDKSDLALLGVMGFLVCIAATFMSTTTLQYSQKTASGANVQAGSLSELNTLMKTNEYYNSYITYLQNQITGYQDSSKVLQIKISQKIAEQKAPTTIITQPIYIIQPAPNNTVLPPPIGLPKRERETDD